MYRLLLIVAVIVYGSLYPWHFDFARSHENPLLVMLHSWPEKWDIFTTRDAILNIAVYFPLGVAAFLAVRRGRSRAAATAAALGAGLILSAGMEMLQVYLPGRVSSIFDVLCDVAGAAAGALVTLRFRSAFEKIARRRSRRFASSAVVLLACWAVYHLFPFLPLLSWERLRFELRLLAHPCALNYCCCSVSGLLTGIWASAAEWFVVALAVQALFGRMRVSWLMAALCIRMLLRPIVITRPLGPDEVMGALLALLLWKTLREGVRLRVALCMLASAVLLRELAPFHFSSIAGRFSWIPFQLTFQSDREVATLDLVRKAFDYGAIGWLLFTTGFSYRKAAVLLAAWLSVLALVQRYLPGNQPSTTDLLLAMLMILVLWLSGRYTRDPSLPPL